VASEVAHLSPAATSDPASENLTPPRDDPDRSVALTEPTAIAVGRAMFSLDSLDIEAIVAALPSSEVPVWLRRRDELVTLLGRLGKALTARMEEEKRYGETVDIDGAQFRFESDRRGEFVDVPGLMYLLFEEFAVSVSDLGRAVSGLRVTDLEAIAQGRSAEPDPGRSGNEKGSERERMMALIREHRIWKDGTPRLIELDERGKPKHR
jgi:hypothetical protein